MDCAGQQTEPGVSEQQCPIAAAEAGGRDVAPELGALPPAYHIAEGAQPALGPVSSWEECLETASSGLRKREIW